jgi:hypothetical protein
MSDSYIGLDQQYTIDLNRVNQIILSKAKDAGKANKEEEEFIIDTTVSKDN